MPAIRWGVAGMCYPSCEDDVILLAKRDGTSDLRAGESRPPQDRSADIAVGPARVRPGGRSGASRTRVRDRDAAEAVPVQEPTLPAVRRAVRSSRPDGPPGPERFAGFARPLPTPSRVRFLGDVTRL